MEKNYIERVIDLTDRSKNLIYNMSEPEATELVRSGNIEAVRKIDGHFAIVAVNGKTVRMARSIGRPMRYFIAKKHEGPNLIVAERIDAIYKYLVCEHLEDQFHPSYTRMVPAHYITTIELIGCPDPNPAYKRFFTPVRNKFAGMEIHEIGEIYTRVLFEEIKKWITMHAVSGPLGISFSGGIDSGSVFLLAYHALREIGQNPARLKAFTLSIEGEGEDLLQARKFLKETGLELFLEPVEIDYNSLDWKEAVKITEDYKPLDIQAATMNLALAKGIRAKYPDWKYILHGEGGDENLKDYPIEENPELTIKSVLNNLMLYHEGWGVDSIKHSLTYSGGLSRGYMRTYAVWDHMRFESFSPYTLTNVIEISEGIPFIEITGWDHNKLYELKGKIMSWGVEKITGIKMPVFQKRRFQQGALPFKLFSELFPQKEIIYRKEFLSNYE
ncbi:MAG: asparagine synthase-related protein [Bacteroidales bacterium]